MLAFIRTYVMFLLLVTEEGQQGLTESGGADMEINVGDILKLKKPHPCGSHEWEVLRVGADFRIKCRGCGHQVMIARRLLEKNIKEIL